MASPIDPTVYLECFLLRIVQRITAPLFFKEPRVNSGTAKLRDEIIQRTKSRRFRRSLQPHKHQRTLRNTFALESLIFFIICVPSVIS